MILVIFSRLFTFWYNFKKVGTAILTFISFRERYRQLVFYLALWYFLAKRDVLNIYPTRLNPESFEIEGVWS